MIDEKKLIKHPYINGYCNKCVYNDNDIDNLCCVKLNYANCGAVIECGSYLEKEVKNNGKFKKEEKS